MTGTAPRWVVVALAAALALSLGAVLWLGAEERGARQDLGEARAESSRLVEEEAAGEDALAAARTLLAQITTYSWQEGEHEFAWLDSVSDDALRQRLAPNVSDLQAAIVGAKVSAEGQVLDAAVRVLDPATVEVVAFVDQAIADEASPDVRVEEQRVSMTMVLVDDEWMLDRLDLLSGANADPTADGDPADGR